MDFDENHNICSITFEAFEKDPCMIWCIPDRFKTQEMCDKAFSVVVLGLNREEILTKLNLVSLQAQFYIE